MDYNALGREPTAAKRDYSGLRLTKQVAVDASCAENSRSADVNCIQARLLYEMLLKETRNTLNAAISCLTQHWEAEQNSYIRHHLKSVAKEVHEIGRFFNARFSTQLDTQDFVAILRDEIALFDRIFAGRVRRIETYPHRLDIVASWISIQLFRSLLHEVIEETVRNSDHTGTIYIRLRRYGKVLRVDINNIELEIRRALLTYFYNKAPIQEKLTALCAQIKENEAGLSISMPMANHHKKNF